MTNPAFILVNPQMGENIGAVARAMMNFGLRDLRIVAPRDGWPNPAAEAMAAHGAEIIHNAKIYDTTREAIADLTRVYAATARDRRMKKPQLAAREAVEEMSGLIKQSQRVGVLFGPERSGLENEDIALAHAIVTIPTDPDHASLNIAQSAVVLAYEWFCAAGEPMEFAETPPSAPSGEVHGMLDALEQALDETHFFKVEAKKATMWQNLRATFMQAGFSSEQVHSLRGVITALSKSRKP